MDKHALMAGHRACAGCGEALGARLAIEAAGYDIVIANATGCLEVFSSKYPESAWGVPWIHSLFENAPAVASGMEAGLKALGKADSVRVIAQGGDGGTADIGFGALSGMLERGHDVLYICYDNEAYMNTGVQRSGLTPIDTRTSTSPPGDRRCAQGPLRSDGFRGVPPRHPGEGEASDEDPRAEVPADPRTLPARLGLRAQDDDRNGEAGRGDRALPAFRDRERGTRPGEERA